MAQLFSCTGPEVEHQLSARLCTKPEGSPSPSLGYGSETAPPVPVPRISSPQHRCWLWIELISTVKAPDKAQHSSSKTLKCHSTCFRQELFFVFQGERGLFYIRQFPLVWAFTGEQKPAMQFFLPRISIRNLDLALVHSFGSKWGMEQKSLCRRDFLKWRNLSLQRRTVVIPYNWVTNQKGWEVLQILHQGKCWVLLVISMFKHTKHMWKGVAA